MPLERRCSVPVRKDQIDEVLDVIYTYLTREQVTRLLHKLAEVQAFESNRSYRETIIRLMDKNAERRATRA